MSLGDQRLNDRNDSGNLLIGRDLRGAGAGRLGADVDHRSARAPERGGPTRGVADIDDGIRYWRVGGDVEDAHDQALIGRIEGLATQFDQHGSVNMSGASTLAAEIVRAASEEDLGGLHD